MKYINDRIRKAMALMVVMVVATATAMAQVKYIDADGTEKTCSTYNTVAGGSNVTWNGSSNDGWYYVSGTNVTINSSATVSGEVKLILADGAKLTVNGAADKAGIVVEGSNSLTVYGQTDGTGVLIATGGDKGAGIGGGKEQTSGTITINGGTITANGAGGGAGIGGGIGGSIGNFTLNRGIVTANGSLLATGVGAGAGPTPKFSVSATKTVEFSRGNLYWDGSSWKFEANQWDYRTWAGKNSCIGGNVSETGTPTNHCGLFKWGNETEAIEGNDDTPTGEFFTEASGFTVDSQMGWSTLSNDEWRYLIGEGSPCRDNASSLCGWVTLSDVSVSGLVILPDGSDKTPSEITNTSLLASSGAVFLPTAGLRIGTEVYNVGSFCSYWSSTLNDWDYVMVMEFSSEYVATPFDNQNHGNPVRLVRSGS